MASTSTNRVFKTLRRVTSVVFPRLVGTVTTDSDDFKFASEADIKALRTMISMLSVIEKVDDQSKTQNSIFL
jgi:hypothetical protein